MRSIVGMTVGKCMQLAKVKPPFDIFFVPYLSDKIIEAAKQVSVNLLQTLHAAGARELSKSLSNRVYAFLRLCPSIVLSL